MRKPAHHKGVYFKNYISSISNGRLNLDQPEQSTFHCNEQQSPRVCVRGL